MAENTTIEQCLQELVTIKERRAQFDLRAVKLRARVQDALRKRIDRAMTSLRGVWYLQIHLNQFAGTLKVLVGRIDDYCRLGGYEDAAIHIILRDATWIRAEVGRYTIQRDATQGHTKEIGKFTTQLPSSRDIINLWASESMESDGVFDAGRLFRTDEEREQVAVILAKSRSILANSQDPCADWTQYVCENLLHRPDLAPAAIVVNHVKELSNGTDR